MRKIPIIGAVAGAFFALALSVQAQTTNWDAWKDFYFAPASVTNSGGSWTGNTNVNPAWQYGAGNVTGGGYAPDTIGWFLPPGGYFYTTTAGGTVPGTAHYTQTAPGDYFAYYTSSAGWGDQVGIYNNVWETNAPGVLGQTNNTYLWLQASGQIAGPTTEALCALLQFTCPQVGTYTFTGSIVGGHGYGVDTNDYVDVAICDSTRPYVGLGTNPPVVPQDLNRTLVQGGTTLPFSFTLTNVPGGTFVQWQTADNFFSPIPAGVQVDVTLTPTPPALLSASRAFLDPKKVTVTFDRSLDTNSAVNPANYSINNGVTVVGAQFSPSDTTGATIILTVSPDVDYASTLTVNGVEGDFGKLPVIANSQANIPALYNVPKGFGTPTNATVVSFAGNTLDPHWVASPVVNDPSQSNYYYGTVWTQSNGAIHEVSKYATNQTGCNFLVWADPAYSNVVEEVLEHITILSANFTSGSVAGATVGVQTDGCNSSPEGGNSYRTVPANYGGFTPNYPVFLWASDFFSDIYPNARWQPWAVGGSYWLRVRSETDPASPDTGVIVSCKAWVGDGSVPEPADWDISKKDPAGINRVGYCAIHGYSATGMDFDVDYFQATSPALPVVTPHLPPSLLPRIDINVALSGGNAVASWPAAAPMSYTLQSSPAPLGPWTNVAQPVVVNGAANTVTVPLNGQQLYFRLVQ